MAAALPLALGGLVGQFAVKKLLGKKKQAAPEPQTPGPVVMPLADDEKVMQARKRSIIAQRSRRGRESTILTGETLGG